METRQRVIDRERSGGDWKVLAESLDVPVVLARQWVRRYADGPDSAARKRGGSKPKLTPEHVLFMCTALDENNKLTLRELAEMLCESFRMKVGTTTVGRKLDGACYTLKKTHVEPQYMNTPNNKLKRRDFLTKLLEYKSHGRKIYFVDETNLNIWISRSQGWSPQGKRSVEQRISGGGQNMHVTACITASGLVYYEKKFGANRAPDVNNFFVNLLRVVRDEHRQPLRNAVFVFDNAPAHTAVESVFGMEEFEGAVALRLGPYSPMLNPIESVFSSFKAKVKSYMAHEAPNVRRVPPGSTMVAHRNSFLQRAADLFMGDAASTEKCATYEAHTLHFYRDVFLLEDMEVGQ